MKRLIKKQAGGNNSDNELMELFESFAQSANDDDFKNGQDVYKEFIKLNPEQQKQFLSSIQNQAPQDEEGEYNEQMQMGGIPETANGYYELNPYENPIAKIPSNKITMKGLKYNIRAVGGSGKDYGEMLPDQEYSFPDEEYMYEIPKLQAGGSSKKSYFEIRLENPEVKEMFKLQANQNRGYLNNLRLKELEGKHLADLQRAEKAFNRTNKNYSENPVQKQKVVVNKEAQLKAEKELLNPKLEKQKAFQESLEKVVPKNKINTEESARILREKNFLNELKEKNSIPSKKEISKIIKGSSTNSKLNKKVSKNVNDSFQKALDYRQKLNERKSFQESLGKTVNKTEIPKQGTIDEIRFKNQQESLKESKANRLQGLKEDFNYNEELANKANKLSAIKRGQEKVKTSSEFYGNTSKITEPVEEILKPISKTQRLIKGAGKVLNSPIAKSLGRGLGAVDAISTGLQAKQSYDNMQIQTMIANDNSPIGKKYQEDLSAKSKFKKGTESLKDFWNVGTYGYENEVMQQYLAEKQGKVKPQQKPASLNQNYKLVNDLTNTKSKELNIPFAKPSVTTTSNVSNNLPVTPETVQQAKDNNQPFVQGKKPPLIKKKNNVSEVQGNPNTGMRTAKDFMTEFGKEELEKQSLEKESNVTPINTSLYAKDILNHKDELVKDKTKALDLPFVQSKPITMEFDNPYEANAIAYKKLKNASVMSPYKGSVNLQTPELYQESITPYVNNIREQRNAVLQQLNPNSTSGQSVLANIYEQGIAQENEAVSNVGRNNAKFTTDWLAQKAETRNRQQQLDYDMNNKYSADVAQLQATQDENDINYMNSISEMNAKRLQAKNALVRTAMETGIGDALDIKDNSFTFDVNKLPKNFYSKDVTPVDGKKRELGKIINVKGIPYETYLDENGKAVMRKVEVQQVGGKSNKYKIFLNNK